MRTLDLPVDPTEIAVGFGAVWVIGAARERRYEGVLRVDPQSGRVLAVIRASHAYGSRIGATDTAIWVGGADVYAKGHSDQAVRISLQARPAPERSGAARASAARDDGARPRARGVFALGQRLVGRRAYLGRRAHPLPGGLPRRRLVACARPRRGLGHAAVDRDSLRAATGSGARVRGASCGSTRPATALGSFPSSSRGTRAASPPRQERCGWAAATTGPHGSTTCRARLSSFFLSLESSQQRWSLSPEGCGPSSSSRTALSRSRADSAATLTCAPVARSWAQLLGDSSEPEETTEEQRGFLGRLRESLSKSRRALTEQIQVAAFDPGRTTPLGSGSRRRSIYADVGVRGDGGAGSGASRRIEQADSDFGAALAEEIAALFGDPPTLGGLRSSVGRARRRSQRRRQDDHDRQARPKRDRATGIRPVCAPPTRSARGRAKPRSGLKERASAIVGSRVRQGSGGGRLRRGRSGQTPSDVLIVDTAGRLHTQTNLMAELAKVRRGIAGRGARRTARNAARRRRDDRSKRPPAGTAVQRDRGVHRRRAHEARRHRERRDRRRDRVRARVVGEARRRWRGLWRICARSTQTTSRGRWSQHEPRPRLTRSPTPSSQYLFTRGYEGYFVPMHFDEPTLRYMVDTWHIDCSGASSLISP